MFVIVSRTLQREFRFLTDCPEAARTFTFIETTPEIPGAAFEPIDIAIERTHGFYRLRLPGSDMVEGTAIGLLDAAHHFLFVGVEQDVPGAPLIHAACVHVGDRPILLIGAKGSGKTTLVVHLLSRGYAVSGDEHVIVREHDLIPRPRTLRVKRSSLGLVLSLADAIRCAPSVPDWNGSPIYAVSPAITGRPWRISPIKDCILVFVEPNHGGHTVAKPISQERAFALLMTRCLLPGTAKAQAVARLRLVAKQARAWEMSLGDLAGAHGTESGLTGLEPQDL